MYRALHVITDDPRISGWLVKHDPQALTQAREALRLYSEVEPTKRERAAALLTDTDIDGILNGDFGWSADEHCESDGSGECLIHFGRLVDTDGPDPDVCDLSPVTDFCVACGSHGNVHDPEKHGL